jgi:hypothetical protein
MKHKTLTIFKFNMKQEHQRFKMKHKILTIFKFRGLGFHRNETSFNNEGNLQIEN